MRNDSAIRFSSVLAVLVLVVVVVCLAGCAVP